MKKLIRIAVGIVILLWVILQLWKAVIVYRETPAIETVVYEFLDALKVRDAERAYAQMVSFEEGGEYNPIILEGGFATWQHLFFERYKGVEIGDIIMIRGNVVVVKGDLLYDNNICNVWFRMNLVKTVKGWKIYTMVMPVGEDDLACIEKNR